MLYSLLTSFVDQFSFLNVFRYLTFRTGLSLISSLIIVFLIGGPFIKYLSQKKITEPIREDGPIDHVFKKIGTPTMGGVVILIGMLVSTLLWADLSNIYIWFLIFIASSFGILGAIDDFLKIRNYSSSGLSPKLKIIIQIFLAFIAVFFLNKFGDHSHLKNLYFPFFKNLILNMGIFFLPFYIFIIIASSNAVNLTDGLDGLATVPVILVAASFAFICYVTGNTVFKDLKSQITCGGMPISEHVKLPKDLTAEEILVRSSNIGTIRIAQKVGVKNYRKFLNSLELFEKINFELEEVGTPLPFKWEKCTLETASFGHGITTTPLQLAKAYAIIGNGGYEIHPTILLNKNITPQVI